MISNIELVDHIGLAYQKVYGSICSVYFNSSASGRFQPGPSWGKNDKLLVVSYQDALELFNSIAPLCTFGGADAYGDHNDRKGLSIACRLAGVPYSHIEKIIGDIRSYGQDAAARAWHEYLGQRDNRICGFLYIARLRLGGIKIGFSKNPNTRVKSFKGGTDIIAAYPATMLHEWAIHQILRRYRIASEIYPESIIETFPFLTIKMLEAV